MVPPEPLPPVGSPRGPAWTSAVSMTTTNLGASRRARKSAELYTRTWFLPKVDQLILGEQSRSLWWRFPPGCWGPAVSLLGRPRL